MTTPPTPGALTTPPASVQRAKMLAFIAAGIGIASQLLTLVANYSSPGNVVAGMIGAAAYIYLGLQLERRKNWARITLGVFAILGAVADAFTGVASLGAMAWLSQLGLGYDAPLLLVAAIICFVGAALLIVLAVQVFNRNTAAWTQPAPVSPF